MLINKNASKICNVFTGCFFSLKFVGTVVTSLYDLGSASIISSHVIAESSILLAKYFGFLQLHVAEFEI